MTYDFITYQSEHLLVWITQDKKRISHEPTWLGAEVKRLKRALGTCPVYFGAMQKATFRSERKLYIRKTAALCSATATAPAAGSYYKLGCSSQHIVREAH